MSRTSSEMTVGLLIHSFRTLMGNPPAQPAHGCSYQQLLGYDDDPRNYKPERQSQKDEPQQSKRKPKHLWSQEEDESLVEGYQKHGFSWKDIANDPMLALENRTGTQIRDRFRKRFPDLYGEAPIPPKEPQHDSNGAAMTPEPKVNQPPATGQYSVAGGEEERRKGDKTGKASGPRSRHAALTSGPHDINGLLNNDSGDTRQTALRSDDWAENVTLAPLLWEDLCTKPMFELD